MIVLAPDPVLSAVAEPVTDFTEAAVVADRLRAAMTASERPAAGLAAPQIGVSLRMFAVADGTVYVNPKIIRASAQTSVEAEGCLSLPGLLYDVERPLAIQMSARNERGRTVMVTLQGFDARVAQHEIDHLDGILISEKGIPSNEGLTPATDVPMMRP